MSLRFRLIGLVAIVLVVSLVAGAGIACYNASRSVGTEMRSALLLGRRAVEEAVTGIRASPDLRRELQRIVRLFEGNRHLRVSLVEDATVAAGPAIEGPLFARVPNWFVRLSDVPAMSERVPVTVDGRPVATVVLTADPRNETLDVWNDFTNTVIVLVLSSAQTILLIYLFIRRALRPLYRLDGALEQIGRGNYATRLDAGLVPELSRLRDSFNRMAGRLAAADADNRRLNEQLLTAQERERGDIARDLHDEVGPYLFAVSMDTATVARLLKEGRNSEAAGHLPLIAEAVEHVQRELRDAVRRLHPIGLAEFGLAEAIDNMIQFWRRRHPEVVFRLAVAEGCEGFGEPIDTIVYRIVQEGLNNALRHGPPRSIAVCIECADTVAGGSEQLVVSVGDDGPGLPQEPGTGFGLRGMAERVQALGGRLNFAAGADGGLTVTAVLPIRPESDLAEAAAGAQQ